MLGPDSPHDPDALHRAIVASLPDAVLLFDRAGRCLGANPAATALLGYTADQLRSLSVGDLTGTAGGEAPDAPAALWERGGARYEAEVRRADGTTVPIEVRAAVVALPGGALGVAAVREIAGRRAVEQRQRDLVVAVGHELRNLLAPIRGFAQLMARRGAYMDNAVRGIVHQTDLMERLVGDLTDVARLQAGRLGLEVGAVDLAEAVRAAADQARSRAEARAIRVEAPAGPLPVAADRARLDQIMGNLLSNAIKYSPAGGEILVRAERAGSGAEARVSVRDRGIGIEADQLPHVFDRFYRAEAEGGPEGLGLGLFVTRGLVQAHGGRIWAESEPGAGSTFTFSLPLAE